jgi:hypothetical protein
MKRARAVMFMMLVVTLVTAPLVSVAQDETQSPTATPERMRQEMAEMRQRMMAEEQAANVRLQALLDRMAGAEGEARIVAITALLRELTEQKIAHQRHMEHMMGMMEQMMGGMMGGGMRGRGAPEPPQP